MRLEFLHHLIAIVDQGKTGRFPPAVLGAETEDGDGVFAGFVEFGEFGTEFVFGDVRSGGVEDVTMVGC